MTIPHSPPIFSGTNIKALALHLYRRTLLQDNWTTTRSIRTTGSNKDVFETIAQELQFDLIVFVIPKGERRRPDDFLVVVVDVATLSRSAAAFARGWAASVFGCLRGVRKDRGATHGFHESNTRLAIGGSNCLSRAFDGLGGPRKHLKTVLAHGAGLRGRQIGGSWGSLKTVVVVVVVVQGN